MTAPRSRRHLFPDYARGSLLWADNPVYAPGRGSPWLARRRETP
jgi:hypothetical protein